jgi:hypothetical protein
MDEREMLNRLTELSTDIKMHQAAVLKLSYERAVIVASLHRDNGMSQRELARWLGVSHVRVYQLVHMAASSFAERNNEKPDNRDEHRQP